MLSYLYNLSTVEIIFLLIGLFGQGLFASRFIVQWIYSEKKGESAIPIIFWYLSVFGGIGLLIYAIFRQDPGCSRHSTHFAWVGGNSIESGSGIPERSPIIQPCSTQLNHSGASYLEPSHPACQPLAPTSWSGGYCTAKATTAAPRAPVTARAVYQLIS